VGAGRGEGHSGVEPDNIGVAGLSVLFALVAVVIVLIAVLLQAWFYNWKVDLLAQRAGPIDPQQTPAAIAQMQLERIETYGWADPKTKKNRTIKIERAMDLVADEMASQQVAAGKEKGGK
jgi:hypothetical protein